MVIYCCVTSQPKPQVSNNHFITSHNSAGWPDSTGLAVAVLAVMWDLGWVRMFKMTHPFIWYLLGDSCKAELRRDVEVTGSYTPHVI